MEENMTGEIMPNPGKETVPGKNKKKFLIFTLLGIVAALCAAYLIMCVKGNTIAVDTQYEVNGVNITGMSREEADAAIREKFEKDYSDSVYEIKFEDLTCSVPVFSYLSIDPSKEIDAALTYDGGPWIGRGLKFIRSLFSGVETVSAEAAPFIADREGLYKEAEAAAQSVYKEPVQYDWKEEFDTVSVTLGIPGKSADAEKIGDDIAAGIEKGNYSGTVTADIIVDEPDEPDVKKIAEAVYVAPEDATYSLKDGELEIIDEKNGKELNEEDLKKELEDAKAGTTVTVKTAVIEPEVTAAKLDELLLADLLSAYHVIDGGSWTQMNNQGLACEAISGAIVMPGEVFSFNERVGDTTPDKGYVEDYAYENNKLVLQYGGGVCRVASTLHAALLYTNLEIVERYNHTSPVHYLPLGMDATVSYPEPDLMFRNNRDYPVKVIMYLADGYVNAEIYGTHIEGEPYVDVQLDNQTSMLVDTYRNYYEEEGGKLIKSEYMYTSSYRDLIPDPTPEPTPVPTAAPEVTEEPKPEEEKENSEEPEPTQGAEPTEEPQPTEEAPQPEEGSDQPEETPQPEGENSEGSPEG